MSATPPTFEIITTPSAGKSLFSKSAIPRNTLLFSDTPLFTLSQSLRDPEELQTRVRSLSQDEQRVYLALSNCRSQESDVSEVMGVFKTNVLPAGEGESGVFPLASRLNHTCTPNVETIYNPKTSKLDVRTLSDVPPSTELTISYLTTRLLLPASERQALLQKSFNFTCSCTACSSSSSSSSPKGGEPSESDARRSLIATNKPLIDSLFPSSPLQAYTLSLSNISACDAESLIVEGAFARAVLAMISIGWGDEREAERWVAESERELGVARGSEEGRKWGIWKGNVKKLHPKFGLLGVRDLRGEWEKQEAEKKD